VLQFLGAPDLGLFLANYLGYWCMGLPMLAIGMVASFLTGSVPVAFVLGLLFNAPLYGMFQAGNYMTHPGWSAFFKEWSLDGQFRDFARGVVSLPAMIYFFSITALMLYVCMMLIGRRHWLGGRDGQSMLGHYLVRTAALAGVIIGLNWLVSPAPAYVDVTAEQLSAVHPDTEDLLASLDPKRPVMIDAYVSPTVPDEYVEQRSNLLSFVREFDRRGGNTLEVRVHEIEPTTDAALRAEQQFNIQPRRVVGKDRGVFRDQEIFLGVAVTSGLEKVVVPFFDRTLPVEYELARSVYTVNQAKRKKVGVLRTDAELFGGFDFGGGMPRSRPEQQIITELKKQYEVVQVDPTNPITERYDVLLAVQPSSLTPPQMTNFVAAVRDGQPTAVFEDPFPSWFGVPGTSEPKQPRNMGMFGGGQPPEPKGDISELWKLLDINLMSGGILANEPFVAWHDYNPHLKIATLSTLPREFVFVDTKTPGAEQPFNPDDPITSGLQEVLIPFPGILVSSRGGFDPLITTGAYTGTIGAGELRDLLGGRGELEVAELERREKPTYGEQYVLAARVKRTHKAEEPPSEMDEASKEADSTDKKSASAKPATKATKIDVVAVSDIDLLHNNFFDMRAQQDTELALAFDNVTFVLNTIDVLAGEDRFVKIRKERPIHRPLERVEQRMERVRQDADELKDAMRMKFEKEKGEAEASMRKSVDELESVVKDLREGKEKVNFGAIREAATKLEAQRQVEQRRLTAKIAQFNQEYEQKSKEQERKLLVDMRNLQDSYKMMAVFLPPIPLLLVALGVYFNRRAKEREGVSRARLR
jgi:ABC-2 type transport system permease protein